MSWPKIKPGVRLALVVLLGLAHGLAYVFLIPPWQHYDEPNHFEVAWLAAHRRGLPQPGDGDPQMSRNVVESMAAHGFYKGIGGPPDLTDPQAPVSIGGFPQLGDPPLYYLLASLPMRLLPASEVTRQLYAGRLVSLGLYLLTLLAAWGLAGELAAPGSSLRWMLPLALALLPAFTDLMTALNNDAGAVAAFSWFLWAGVRLLKRGFSLTDFLWAVAAVVLGIFTKRTAWMAVPLLLLVLVFSLARGKWRRLAWGMLVAGGLAGLAAVFSWQGTAFWYTQPDQPARVLVSQPSLPGVHAFQVATRSSAVFPSPAQILPQAEAVELRGQEVTLGAWMWVAEGTHLDQVPRARSPILHLRPMQQDLYQDFELTSKPHFYAFTIELPRGIRRAWLILDPLAASDISEASAGETRAGETRVFIDGVVLAEGRWPTSEPPVFSAAGGRTGSWGGQPFTNLVRNGSAEAGWPQVRPWAERLGTFLFPDYGFDRISLALYTLLDLPATGPYYRSVANLLLQTFWARFGWGHVPLAGSQPYRLLAIATLLGLVGAAWAAWRRRRCLPGDILLFLGLALLTLWGPTLVRGSNYIFLQTYLPVARYAFPVVIPTLLLLLAGWLELAGGLERWLKLPPWVKEIVFVGLFLALDGWALVSIWRFYYS